MSSQEPVPHIAMIPSPGMGHLIPIVELAKLFVSRHRFSVTFIITNTCTQIPKSQQALLQSLPENLNHISLPPAGSQASSLGGSEAAAATTEAAIGRTLSTSLTLIHEALTQLTKRAIHLSAIVIDPFGLDVGDMAKQLKVPLYMYFGTAAMNLLFVLHLPRLDREAECEYVDMPDPVTLPGCVSLHGKDFADPFQDRSGETYKQFLDQSSRFRDSVEGILLNSYAELEPGAIQALMHGDDHLGCPPVYPIGPIIQSGFEDAVLGSDYMRWLDHQPRNSVLFVSFGSGGTLSSPQLNELALGLEMSGQRFLWILRSPNDKSSCPSYCGDMSQDNNNPLVFLPSSFLERTKDRGLVVPSWACQVKVLGHVSTAGFLTHCGWNSALESIVHGVPLIAWPLYAEQKTNAVLLTEGLKVALRPKANEKRIVDRHEVSKVVRDLMDGDEGRRVCVRARELKESAHKAIGEDGSSTEASAKVAIKWREFTLRYRS